MWRSRIQVFTKAAVFKSPANEVALKKTEAQLQIELPVELRKLFSESNGVEGEYGQGLVWSCEQIMNENQKFRSNSDFLDLYMPFNSLLFFADAGDGNQFAFAIRNGQIQSSDVYIWNHENDSRTWVASSLEKYLERCSIENGGED